MVNGGITVTVFTLPSAKLLTTYDLIKLNVEGVEYGILSFAACEIIARHKII